MDGVAYPAAAIPAQTPADPVAELLVHEEPVIRRLVARYVHFRPVQDDLVQEICLKALRRGGDLRDPVAAKAWLFTLVRTTCLDWLRMRMRRPDEEQHDEHLAYHQAQGDQGRAPMDHLLTQERLTAVRKALEALPESQREAITLRIEEGLDHDGIAERLGISRQAVEVRLCRGRAKLKDQLAEIFEGDL